MKCENCPLTYSDYSEIIEDGDCYCLVTNDYVFEEGHGCRRTNKWIKSQDRKAWLKRLEEQRDKAIEDYVAYCEAELHEKNFNDELDIFDIAVGEQLDFEQWLGEEHKEKE